MFEVTACCLFLGDDGKGLIEKVISAAIIFSRAAFFALGLQFSHSLHVSVTELGFGQGIIEGDQYIFTWNGSRGICMTW